MDSQHGFDNPIDWKSATIGAGFVGGAAYGLTAALFVTSGPAGWLGWLPTLAMMMAFVAVGVRLCDARNRATTRTVGAALASSVLVGAAIVVELMLWGALRG